MDDNVLHFSYLAFDRFLVSLYCLLNPGFKYILQQYYKPVLHKHYKLELINYAHLYVFASYLFQNIITMNNKLKRNLL